MRLFAAHTRKRPDTGGLSSAPPDAHGVPLIGVTMYVMRDEQVFSEGEPADYVYKVVRGGVRGFRIHADGRRQIGDFYLPGEVFGLEFGARYRFTAEALADTILVVTPSVTIGHEWDAARTNRLWAVAIGELHHAQAHTLTLGRRAGVRVASFLCDMADRIGEERRVELPMSRQDIADYLGLTIDAVCRAFGQLEDSGLIALASSRSIHLRKPGALAELCA